MNTIPVLICADVFESLGLGWQDILFHAINLAILIVALRFLLYKPVKQIVDNHKKRLEETFEKNKKLEEENIAVKAEYKAMLEDAKKEAVRISTEAAANAKKKSEETIENARLQAKSIMDAAMHETEAEKERLKNSYRDTVRCLSVEIAERVLQREIDDKDTDRIVDESLKEWEKQ